MSTHCLVYCGALDAELHRLVDAGAFAAELQPVDSGLCTDPPALGRALRRHLTARQGRPVLLVYGHCLPGIDALARHYGARRVPASNCMAMLLGEAEYTRRVAAGCFFLLPEWAGRWRAILQGRLGLSPAVAAELLSGELSQAVYLDTGVADHPADALTEFALYSGLPVTRQAVGLDHLAQLLRAALSDRRLERMAGQGDF